MVKRIVIALAVVLVLLVVVAVGAAMFVDANQFRPILASKMSEALGRQVTIGSLKVSWLAGGISAEDLAIADDPKFSRDAFVSAKSVAIGVDIMPLILSRSLRVESFTLDRPRVELLRSNAGTWNFSSLGTQSSSSGSIGAMSVLIQKIKISGGQVIVAGLDGRSDRRTYDDVDVSVTDVSFTSRFPFSVSAKTPGGGTVTLDGHAGPFNMKDMAATPFDGSLAIKHLDVAATGFVDPASGIAGIVDFSGSVTADGTVVNTKGRASATGVRLLPGAGASRVPIAVDYESVLNTKTQAGQLKQGDIHIGSATARLTGDYRTAEKSTSVRLMLKAAQMPIADLEAALPAIGVTLPQGATLKEGGLDLNLSIDGPVDRLTIAGPITLSNGRLTGFDLGAKLGGIAALAGLQRVGDTTIDTLSAMLKMTPAGTALDAINLVVPSIGTLTGDGTIAPNGRIDFAMTATLKDRPIVVPFRIEGTTSSPSFAPDMGRVVKNATDQLKEAAKNPDNLKKAADAISGLFGRKK